MWFCRAGDKDDNHGVCTAKIREEDNFGIHEVGQVKTLHLVNNLCAQVPGYKWQTEKLERTMMSIYFCSDKCYRAKITTSKNRISKEVQLYFIARLC